MVFVLKLNTIFEKARHIGSECSTFFWFNKTKIIPIDSEHFSIWYALKDIDKTKYNLTLIGDGKEKNNLSNQINYLNLQKNVKLLGFKENVYPYLKNSDLLINPSYFEGFPNVVIEALSCGIPVICSKSHGGIYEILKNQKYGDLFENGNADDLKIKIINFLKNTKRLNNKSIRGQRDLDRFSEIQSAKKYERIFLKL